MYIICQIQLNSLQAATWLQKQLYTSLSSSLFTSDVAIANFLSPAVPISRIFHSQSQSLHIIFHRARQSFFCRPRYFLAAPSRQFSFSPLLNRCLYHLSIDSQLHSNPFHSSCTTDILIFAPNPIHSCHSHCKPMHSLLHHHQFNFLSPSQYHCLPVNTTVSKPYFCRSQLQNISFLST